MKKTLVILALFILFSSMFVYAQTTGAATTAPSPAEIVKRCLDAGKSRDECMRECIQYTTSDECERLLPKPSILRRIADVFKPTETAKPEECCCAVDNKYYSMNEKACIERKGRCADWSLCKQPEVRRPETCELERPEPVNPDLDISGCEDCAVTVCFNAFHQELLCLDGYKRCVEKYSFCRPVFCQPTKIQCGTCPGCPPCEQPKECCCMPYKNIMADSACIERKGRCADLSACREQERVCCSFPTPTAVTYAPTPIPPQVLTTDICKEKGGSPVEMKYCEAPPKECCCQPYKQTMTEDVCKARQGRCADVSVCEEAKECCCQPYKQVMTEDICRSRQGKCDAVEACKEVPTERVCCQYSEKFEYSTIDACRKTQGLRTDTENCGITCCKYPTQTTAVAAFAPKAPEKIPLGTCLKRGGTSTSLSYCEMPTIQPLPTPTLTVPNVCCEVRTGYYEMTAKDRCKRAVDESYCRPTIATPQISTVARASYIK